MIIKPLDILLLEDDEDDAFLIREYLQRGLGEEKFRLAHAASIPEAFEKMRGESYEVMLVDYRLGAEDGIGFLREVRSRGIATPAIFLTGQGDQDVAVAAMKAGASDYLLKGRLEAKPLAAAVRFAVDLERARRQQSEAEEALRQSEERYRQLVELSPDGILVSCGGRVVFANRAQAQILGASDPDQILGRNVIEFIHPDYRDRLRARMQEVAGPGFSFFEGVGVRLDNSTVEVEFAARAILWQGVPAAEVIARDITQRRRFERRQAAIASATRPLAEAETVLEAMHAVLQSLCEAFEWEVGEFLGLDRQAGTLKHLDIWVKPEAGFEAFAAASRGHVFAPGRGLPGTTWATGAAEWIADLSRAYHFERKDLAAQAGLVSAVCFPVTLGTEVLGVFSFFARHHQPYDAWLLDQVVRFGGQVGQFLQRKRVEDQNRQLAAIVDSSEDAIIGIEPDGTIRSWNNGAERTYGWKAEEIIGRPAWLLAPEDLQAELRSILEETLRGQARQNYPTVRVRKDGRRFDAASSIFPIRERDGSIVGVSSISRDVTQMKRLEEQLRQAQKMEALGQLAGGVAHDFNNLLTVIIGCGDLLADAMPEEHPLRPRVTDILAASERAAGLTRQLLAFGRKQVVRPQLVDLNDIVRNLLSMLRRLIGEDVDIVLALDSCAMPIRIDPGQLELVLMNLATNGRDAMPRGGRLTIETRPVTLDEEAARRVGTTAGSHVLLAVSDTGTGMDQETLSHIFEPFFTTKEPGRGTGLGLPSVYGIIKQSNGGIWVYSEVGRGSTFKIYFPLQVASDPRDRAAATAAARSVRGRETILLAEDEPQIRQMVRDALQGYGYSVLVAADVEDCRRLAESHHGRIDLILTDVVMPGMSGRELAEHVRALRPEIRVLYMSGYTDDAITRHGLLLPGCQLIEKPFTPLVLAERIRQVLDSDRAEAAV